MSDRIRIAARGVGATGLAGVAALHTIWALGNPWPARDSRELAEAVIGQPDAMPGAAPTAVVAAGAAGASLLATGLLGDGKLQRVGLGMFGTGLLLRAAFGGDAALTVLQLPPAGERFRSLDLHYYRPFAAFVGFSLCVASMLPRIPKNVDNRPSE